MLKDSSGNSRESEAAWVRRGHGGGDHSGVSGDQAATAPFCLQEVFGLGKGGRAGCETGKGPVLDTTGEQI